MFTAYKAKFRRGWIETLSSLMVDGSRSFLDAIKEDKDWNLCNTEKSVQALTQVNYLS